MNEKQVEILSERVILETFAQVFMPDRSERDDGLKITLREKLTEDELSQRLDQAIRISAEKLTGITFGERGPASATLVDGETQPVIVWRSRLSAPPNRVPVEVDVQDGRAEYVLSCPYNLAEGSKIEVINGRLLFTGSSAKVS